MEPETGGRPRLMVRPAMAFPPLVGRGRIKVGARPGIRPEILNAALLRHYDCRCVSLFRIWSSLTIPNTGLRLPLNWLVTFLFDAAIR